MWLSWIAVAYAGTPVVYDGGVPTDVIAAVSQRTGLPTSQLEAVPLEDLLEAPPQGLGGAVVRRCTRSSPSQNSTIQTELVRAEVALAQSGDPAAALDHLDLAVAELGCLGELVESKTAAKVFLMRGALQAEISEETARGELRTALAFDREVAWMDKLPAAGKQLFDEERANPTSFQLHVAPAASPSGPWLDGRIVVVGSVGTQVQQGLHLAQYGTPMGIRSAWLVIAGDATVVLPGSFRRPILERFANPDDWPEVQSLIAAALPNFFAAYVTHAGGLWLVSLEDNQITTTEIAPIPPPTPEPETGKKKKNKRDKKDKKSRRK